MPYEDRKGDGNSQYNYAIIVFLLGVARFSKKFPYVHFVLLVIKSVRKYIINLIKLTKLQDGNLTFFCVPENQILIFFGVLATEFYSVLMFPATAYLGAQYLVSRRFDTELLNDTVLQSYNLA